MFFCDFPGCEFKTDLRSQIVDHHIVPKSMGGKNNKGNYLRVCPNHHSHIYVDGITTGIHSKKNNDSIILIGKFLSTSGNVIQYKSVNSEEINFSLITY
jgi:hypothetical protein